ncbi:hypothetical protein N9B57_05020 [Verrucomicrobia bacterium]|nr:hypothetical protein [Verrucomicrobiota bacterium]MDA7867282.1 hypothetical protein [Verrucomicrobiota bacterium]
MVVWAESFPLGTEISYLISDTDGNVSLLSTALTKNTRGRYENLVIGKQSAIPALILSRFTNRNTLELRSFQVDFKDGIRSQDSYNDTIPDLAELRIVDADPSDMITSIEQVLPTADFDLDGFDNGQEIRENPDPIDPSSVPSSNLIVTLEVLNGISSKWANEGLGSFTIRRSGEQSAPLEINVIYGGSATPGADDGSSPP